MFRKLMPQDIYVELVWFVPSSSQFISECICEKLL